LTNDPKLSEEIIEVKKLVNKYCFYSNSIEIGVTYSPRDMSFSEMMLFSWIKDGLSHGRKTGV
jgi:hypothetical protein